MNAISRDMGKLSGPVSRPSRPGNALSGLEKLAASDSSPSSPSRCPSSPVGGHRFTVLAIAAVLGGIGTVVVTVIPASPPTLTPSQRRAASETGLQRYFDAVSLPLPANDTESRAEKLARIADTFAEDCVLIQPDGGVQHGREGVEAFYNSSSSLKLPDFKPVPLKETMAYSDRGDLISVEIDLPLEENKVTRVGDFFTFSEKGLITRLRMYGSG